MKRIISVFAVALLLVMAFASFAVSAEESTFHVTHYNDSAAEGACVIFTETYSGGGWWIHVAFAPVEGKENTYEIVEMVNGVSDGSGVPLEIPEGGFVYGLNTGNNWGDLTQAAIDAGNFESQWWYGNYQQDQEYYTTNFVNEATKAMITTTTSWVVGDVFVIHPRAGAQRVQTAGSLTRLLLRLIQAHVQQRQKGHIIAQPHACKGRAAQTDLTADAAINRIVPLLLLLCQLANAGSYITKHAHHLF